MPASSALWTVLVILEPLGFTWWILFNTTTPSWCQVCRRLLQRSAGDHDGCSSHLRWQSSSSPLHLGPDEGSLCLVLVQLSFVQGAVQSMYFSLSRLVRVPSQKEVFWILRVFPTLCSQSFPVEAPYILHALPSQNCLSCYFWLAMTSDKPISLTTRLADNPTF